MRAASHALWPSHRRFPRHLLVQEDLVAAQVRFYQLYKVKQALCWAPDRIVEACAPTRLLDITSCVPAPNKD